jgi:hypothetical protein
MLAKIIEQEGVAMRDRSRFWVGRGEGREKRFTLWECLHGPTGTNKDLQTRQNQLWQIPSERTDFRRMADSTG